MKKNILPIFLCLLTLSCFGQDISPYTVRGGIGNPFLVKDDYHTWVYLLNGLSGAEISYTSPNDTGTHVWYRYKEGTSDRTPVPPQQIQQTGNTYVITGVEDGYGYYVENSTDMSNHYLWIIDYSHYVPVLNSLKVEESDDKCEMIKLIIDITAPNLQYYSSAGKSLNVARNYNLDYYTMEWNGSVFVKDQLKEEKISSPNGVSEFIVDPAPLQNTEFVFSGDQIAEHFGLKKSMNTPEYEAIAVKAEILTDTISTTADNEMMDANGSLSAPVNFTYTAYANEPVATFYTWKVYNLDRSDTEPVSQTTSKTLNYTFDEVGRYQVDLEVSDSHSICTYKTTLSDIFVSDFMLWVPNAFSPTTSPGVNDIFKVAYKSVIKFNGWIYNRWGNELFHWSDPTQGWDGKYRGKYVPPGAYFYVIEATSADGKKHIKKGDVNIVGGR